MRSDSSNVHPDLSEMVTMEPTDGPMSCSLHCVGTQGILVWDWLLKNSIECVRSIVTIFNEIWWFCGSCFHHPHIHWYSCAPGTLSTDSFPLWFLMCPLFHHTQHPYPSSSSITLSRFLDLGPLEPLFQPLQVFMFGNFCVICFCKCFVPDRIWNGRVRVEVEQESKFTQLKGQVFQSYIHQSSKWAFHAFLKNVKINIWISGRRLFFKSSTHHTYRILVHHAVH